ncbi:hypothetical protein FE783_24715 [Paenibacillus mesophilus]|uniref:multicopper oxidase domain-containing protein n=1 Tax=Paenibacillus mesophilus TaxID=2582849 RepID=UPI00110DAB72|nr:multicopper oxidase domain-containing protein [Paenibacillus mesophilus]TMV46845.1 hypothetical protein FE783_24715 [Paenibacillus mesophilus]
MIRIRGFFSRLLPLLLLSMTMIGLLQPGRTHAVSSSGTLQDGLKHFELYATDGYLTLPDGEQVYIWGYSLENKKGSAVYPAPTLVMAEGDNVEVTLTNIGPSKEGIKRLAHTIHWHGLDTDQANDGVPHTSPAIQVGESFTYRFEATHAGTYFYHCHVDTIEHLQMGMHGSLIVKAKDGAKQAWTGGPSYDKEYVFHLNEIDPVWHHAVENGLAYDRTDFHPRYWTINGKAFPNLMEDPDSFIEGTVGETVLVRLINSGYEEHPFHLHGHHFQVIATDGRPLPVPYEKDTINIGSGERYDILIKFTQSGEFPFHSHKITDNTNNGVYPGGLHTMTSVKAAETAVHGHSAGGGHGSHDSVAGSQPTSDPVDSVTDLAQPQISIGASAYSIKELRIQRGTAVTWVNDDSQIHTVSALDGSFESKNIVPKQAWSHTFDKAGTYIYYCATHPSMEAKIIVE